MVVQIVFTAIYAATQHGRGQFQQQWLTQSTDLSQMVMVESRFLCLGSCLYWTISIEFKSTMFFEAKTWETGLKCFVVVILFNCFVKVTPMGM